MSSDAEGGSDRVLKDLVDPEVGQDGGLVVRDAQVLRHDATLLGHNQVLLADLSTGLFGGKGKE